MCLLCVLKKSQRRPCIQLLHAFYYCSYVACVRLSASYYRITTSKRIILWPSPSISAIALAQFAEGLHFSVLFVNPCWRSECYVSWFVCVCVSTFILAFQATRRPISDTSSFRTTRAWKIKGRFWLRSRDMPWKQAKKPICIIALGLLWPDPLHLHTLEAQEVTTNGTYRLPHAIYYRS